MCLSGSSPFCGSLLCEADACFSLPLVGSRVAVSEPVAPSNSVARWNSKALLRLPLERPLLWPLAESFWLLGDVVLRVLDEVLVCCSESVVLRDFDEVLVCCSEPVELRVFDEVLVCCSESVCFKVGGFSEQSASSCTARV